MISRWCALCPPVVLAASMYRLALATPEGNVQGGQWDETRSRLAKLTGTKAPTGMELLRDDPNGNELSQLRSVKLKRLVPGSATAEFFLLFSPGPKVEKVEFISGSEKSSPLPKYCRKQIFRLPSRKAAPPVSCAAPS